MGGVDERIGEIAIKMVAAGKLGGFLDEYPELMQVLSRRVCAVPPVGPTTPVRKLRDLCRLIDEQETNE